MIRFFLHGVSYPVIYGLKPVKLFAWRTRFPILKRLILAVTTPMDFILIWLNVQNKTMLLHWKVYRGNFIFGRGIMVTDYATTAEAIAEPAFKSNNFMGVSIVASDCSAFATNSGVLNQCPPLRESTRGYLDENIFTPEVLGFCPHSIGSMCSDILEEWRAEPKMATTLGIRTTATQIFLKVLSGKKVERDAAALVTRRYIRSFVELSLFSGYFPPMLDILGTHKRVRQDAYFPLKNLGIDVMTIDITLFAAMFSIGTLVLRCVEDARRFDIEYGELGSEEKRRFVIEAVRLYPTVTSVHRIVEHDEEMWACGKKIQLTPGDEVVYPFVCSNRDPVHFPDPDRIRLDRREEEYEKVLSWSKGPHSCPAKEMSIMVTALMLDSLNEHCPLKELKIWNPEF